MILFKLCEIPDEDDKYTKEKSFCSTGLDSEYYLTRTKLGCSVIKNNVTIYSVEYNSMGLLLGKRKNTSYFEVFNYRYESIGFLDEIPRKKNLFACKLDDNVYCCKQLTSKEYVVYKDGEILSHIIRSTINGCIEYEVACEDDYESICILLSLYIDRKWFEEEKLEARSDKGLYKEAIEMSYPLFAVMKYKKKKKELLNVS